MSRVSLGAVGYLNARPLVSGLDASPRFALRFDVPSRCADLLHQGSIDVGLIPSIEYHGTSGSGTADEYRIVPDLAIASRGPVASVMLYARRDIADVRSIALDTSSRTSVALTRVLCANALRISPRFEPQGPDLRAMLDRADAALLIGDNALFLEDETLEHMSVNVIDLGETWTRTTGLPFVWAFWAGRPAALTADDVRALAAARDDGVARMEELARDYSPGDARRQALGARYLRDNIRYHLGEDERAGLELFYRYALETGVIRSARSLRLY